MHCKYELRSARCIGIKCMHLEVQSAESSSYSFQGASYKNKGPREESFTSDGVGRAER